MTASMPTGAQRPYEHLDTSLRLVPEDVRRSADLILDQGYIHHGERLADIRPPIAWSGRTRSFSSRLHAWGPIDALLAAYSVSGKETYLTAAIDYAADWLVTHQLPALEQSTAAIAAGSLNESDDFAWYPHAVGLRLYRLAFVADTLLRHNIRDPKLQALALDAVRFHQELLTHAEMFLGHSNHGLYQALAQVAAARRLAHVTDLSRFETLGQARLVEMIRSLFEQVEGLSREHSTGYHWMVLGTLLGAREAELLDGAQCDLVHRAQMAMAWMLTPARQLVPFGDSDAQRLKNEAPDLAQFSVPPLQFLLSDGAVGEPPPSGVQHYPASGYAFARIYDRDAGESPKQATYLAQMTAFHSRVHKQADHMTFVWCEGEETILTDPGLYGYIGRTAKGDGLYEQGFWYSDPKRVYVESTRAHNCVEIDAKSYPRTKSHAFGSGLTQADAQAGLVVFDSQIVHRPSMPHRRTLILAPREFLLVVDWLYDRTEIPHDFRQWFKMAPGWSVGRASTGFQAAKGDLRLSVVPLLADATASEVFEGAVDPLQGWVSEAAGAFTPAPSFHFVQAGVNRGAFATLFSLSGPVEVAATTRVNQSISKGVFAWRAAGREERVDITRDDTGVAVTRVTRMV